MFWDKGYAPSQTLEGLLENKDAKVEDFLDDEDILQECKSQKKSLIKYFNRPDVIKRLVQLIVIEPSEELPMNYRFHYANMACEILTLGIPSLDEKILSDPETLHLLYSYLLNEPPLNPLLSSFFSKTFSMLFTKKAEQDWFLYQQTCLEFFEYIKMQDNFLTLVCKHFSTPIIPDLIMQMMKEVEGGSLKRYLYQWLTKDKLVERLIDILSDAKETDKHASVSEFLCDLIQQGRSMRQTESENDSFEPAFDGSNPILKAIESESTISALLDVILVENAQESAIVSGISVVLTLMKPMVFVDEPNSDRLRILQSREKDFHDEVLETVIRVIAPRLKEFNELMKNQPTKPEIVTTAETLTQPFGMVRLQICRVFTVLLQTHNEKVTKAICETDFFVTLLTLFKQYCWNNFLHSEVEKCLQLVFYTNLSNNNSTQGSTIVNDGSFNKHISGDNNLSLYIFGGGNGDNNGDSCSTEDNGSGEGGINDNEINATTEDDQKDKETNDNEDKTMNIENKQEEEKLQKDEQENIKETADDKQNELEENNASDTTAVPTDTGPSVLQTYVIAQCKIVSKLIDCWQHNKEQQSAEKGCRLGYMGHLMKIFKHITTCISEFEHIGALIENNLSDASEVELWQSIINPNDGDFTQALAIQNKMLANCNAHEAADYSQQLPKEFLNDNITSDYFDEFAANLSTNLDDILSFDPSFDPSTVDQFGRNLDQDDEDDDDATGGGTGHSLLFKSSSASTSALHTFGVKNSPWDSMDPFNEPTPNCIDIVPATTPWATDFPSDNFADFDAHFSSFANDLGDSLSAVSTSKDSARQEDNDANAFNIKATPMAKSNEEYDNNANVEKSAAEFAKFEDDENAKNEKVAAAAGRLVLHDSEDDYEDDDGIWTKPVGRAAVQQEVEDDSLNALTNSTHISNGPTKLEKDNDNEKLNNSNDITASPTNEAVAVDTVSDVLKTVESEGVAATDKKIASNIAAVNTAEIVPTS